MTTATLPRVQSREPVRKLYVAGVAETKILSRAERKLRAVISTSAVDRDGDVIEVAGWELDNFRKNPVVLWAHDSRQPPIARALSVTKVVSAGLLEAIVQFARFPFAKQIFDLYEEGYLRAWSVGFMPLDPPKPMEESARRGLRRGVRFTRQELLEFSAVPVPANPEALSRMLRRALGSAHTEPGALRPTGLPRDLAPADVGAAAMLALARVLGVDWRPAPKHLGRAVEIALDNVLARHLGRVHHRGGRIQYPGGRAR